MLSQLRSGPWPLFFVFILAFVVACSPAPDSADTEVEVTAGSGAVEEPAEPEITAAVEEPEEAATDTPEPTATVAPEPTATAIPEPTATPEPEPTETAVSPTPEPTVVREPLIPLGSTASWTASTDPIGIDGEVEVLSATQIKVSGFVFLAAEAPGVDIRLGIDDDFSDGVGVSLKDITGDTYEGRSLTLNVPDAAFDGRTFNSIGVFCFATGDLFDWAPFAAP